MCAAAIHLLVCLPIATTMWRFAIPPLSQPVVLSFCARSVVLAADLQSNLPVHPSVGLASDARQCQADRVSRYPPEQAGTITPPGPLVRSALEMQISSTPPLQQTWRECKACRWWLRERLPVFLGYTPVEQMDRAEDACAVLRNGYRDTRTSN